MLEAKHLVNGRGFASFFDLTKRKANSWQSACEAALAALNLNQDLIMSHRPQKSTQPRLRGALLVEETLGSKRVLALYPHLKNGQKGRPLVKSEVPTEIVPEYLKLLERHPYLKPDWKLLGRLDELSRKS